MARRRADVDLSAIQQARARRALSREVFQKTRLCWEVGLREEIVSNLIANEVTTASDEHQKLPTASEKYQRYYGSLSTLSRRWISWFAHNRLDKDVIASYFPTLPEPFRDDDIGRVGVKSLEDAVKEKEEAIQRLQAEREKDKHSQNQARTNPSQQPPGSFPGKKRKANGLICRRIAEDLICRRQLPIGEEVTKEEGRPYFCSDLERVLWHWPKLQETLDSSASRHFQVRERVEKAREEWNGQGGKDLEEALKSGAIALVDAKWLIDFVAAHRYAAVIPCRQHLPKEAFLSFEEISAATFSEYAHLERIDEKIFGGFNIVAISYMWLHPDHPDPKGATLRLIVLRLLEAFQFLRNVGQTPIQVGIFWDYISLFQHPDKQKGSLRTDEEEKLFQAGLQSMSSFYFHKNTRVWKVTELPQGYPEGYNLPPQFKCAGYDERGWPFLERSLAGLNEDKRGVVDVGYSIFQESKHSPLRSPEEFSKELEYLSFTNDKEDRDLVARLYRDRFVQCFATKEYLKGTDWRWRDTELQLLSDFVGPRYTPKLASLNLEGNKFGAPGCAALASALLAGGKVALKEINLSRTHIGDCGIEELAHALVQIPQVDLCEIDLGLSGCQHLADAAKKAGANGSFRLLKLRLNHNPLIMSSLYLHPDKTGLYFLSAMFQHLTHLSLRRCGINDAACRTLANAAAKFDSPLPLQFLELAGNHLRGGSVEQLCRLVGKCPNLQQIWLPREREPARHIPYLSDEEDIRKRYEYRDRVRQQFNLQEANTLREAAANPKLDVVEE